MNEILWRNEFVSSNELVIICNLNDLWALKRKNFPCYDDE